MNCELAGSKPSDALTRRVDAVREHGPAVCGKAEVLRFCMHRPGGGGACDQGNHNTDDGMEENQLRFIFAATRPRAPKDYPA